MVEAEGSGRPGEAAGLVLPLSVSQVGASTASSACDSVEAPRSMVGGRLCPEESHQLLSASLAGCLHVVRGR